MEINIDKITSYIYKALDILLIKKPEKTAYGILFGVFLFGLKTFFCTISSEAISKALKEINFFITICTGVVICRVDILFTRETIDKKWLGKLNIIQKAISEGDFTKKEKRQMYRTFIESIYENVNIEKEEYNDRIKIN